MDYTPTIILLLLHIQLINSNELSPRHYVESIFKYFQIPNTGEDDDYYCPRRHTSTLSRNLCFYITTTKRTRSSAIENCFKKSHRLVEIDSNFTWTKLVYALRKVESNYVSMNVKGFHIGLLKIQNSSNVWNNSEIELNKNFLCKKNSTFESALTSKNKCVELKPNNSSLINFCLIVKDCNTTSTRHSICEWRGDKIEDFSVELREELIKSYFVIIGVFLAYIAILYLLYLSHRFRSKNQIEAAVKNYEDELKIFNLDVTKIKFS
jgi:hypothetical protein